MDINVIASGSWGNACIITHGINHMLIDAGISTKTIGKAFRHHLTDLDGVLVSHEHMDHAKGIRDLTRLGIDCYMSKGTAEALSLSGHRIHHVSARKQLSIGPWSVLPFDLIHDATEPFGFLVAIEDCKLLYAIDTAYIPYRFNGVTHFMLESNYSLDILRERKAGGKLHPAMKRRLMQSHMNINTVKKFLQANDLSRTEEIWLLHLSDSHSDEKRFKEEIQKLTGKVVKVA